MSRIVVIDTETTGMDHEKDRLVELAACWMVPDLGLAQFSAICDPGIPIPPEAMAVHHITDSMVSGFQTQEHNAGLLQAGAGPDTIWAAHNAAFDRGFLPQLPGQWICTWRCSMHLWPEAPGHGNQVLRYWLKLPVDLPEGLYPHRALYDAVVTHALLMRMLETHSVEDLLRLSLEPVILHTVRFGKHRGMLWSEVPRDYLQWVRRQTDMDPDVMHTVKHILRA